jgi:DNA-binding IclR family transcriptional regulator
MAPRKSRGPEWTFLTNHAHVLLYLVRNPAARIRDIAEAVGITERAVQRIIAEMAAAGYLDRRRQGRQNTYRLHTGMSLRHPVEQHRRVGDLIALIEGPASGKRGKSLER